VGFRSSSTPADRQLARGGILWQQKPPRGASSVRLTVRDTGGIDCDGALYIFAAWRDLEASVWVTHETAGTLHLIDQGSITKGADLVSLKLREDEVLTITATGPDAHEALEVCREMLEAHPLDRREMYRNLRKERT
jgi:phosphotransferase system HPr-like phosphotransfer protein